MARTSTTWSTNGRWDDEDELAETYTRRKGFAYGVQRPAGAADRAAEERARRPSTSPTRTSTRSSSASPPSTIISTRWAASAARCGARQGRHLGAGLYRRSDPRRRARCARCRSRSRWKPAPACSIRNGTRACSSTATKACARSRRTSPTPWAGRRPRARSRPGSTSSSRETFVLDPEMRERLARSTRWPRRRSPTG